MGKITYHFPGETAASDKLQWPAIDHGAIPERDGDNRARLELERTLKTLAAHEALDVLERYMRKVVVTERCRAARIAGYYRAMAAPKPEPKLNAFQRWWQALANAIPFGRRNEADVLRESQAVLRAARVPLPEPRSRRMIDPRPGRREMYVAGWDEEQMRLHVKAAVAAYRSEIRVNPA